MALILGGSGTTSGYQPSQLAAKILQTPADKTQIRIIGANKSEHDILLRDAFDNLQVSSKGQLKVTYVLSHPSKDWKGLKGHVNADVTKENAFGPGEGYVALLCGPPGMIRKAAGPALMEWGLGRGWIYLGFRS